MLLKSLPALVLKRKDAGSHWGGVAPDEETLGEDASDGRCPCNILRKCGTRLVKREKGLSREKTTVAWIKAQRQGITTMGLDLLK